MPVPPRALTVAVLGTILLVGGCSAHRTPTPRSSPTAPATSASSAASVTAPSSPDSAAGSTSSAPGSAAAALGAMSEAERVGQLFMVGAESSSLDPDAVSAIDAHHVGAVILMGNSNLSVQQVATLTGQLQRHATGPAGLFIATDQEGGEVQRLRGPGFTTIPSAVDQGQLAPSALQTQAQQWGGELAAAGLNLDLAPVLDTVPSAAFAPSNPPIGQLDREYGYDPATVTSHGSAVQQGLSTAGVDTAVKHFPGLGRVTANTDLSANVTDPTTTSTDPYLAPFRAAITAGTPFVMVSLAVYLRIDSTRPAVFSSTVIGTLLRGQLGFSGVVISDDLGAAKAVASYSVADRALDFIAAGGDMVLTVDPTLIPAMTAAVLARAQSDPAFATLVDAAALHVLQAKQARGLLR